MRPIGPMQRIHRFAGTAAALWMLLGVIGESPAQRTISGRSLRPTAPGTPQAATLAPGAPGNVLILVADDMGVDMVGAYGIGTDLPPTPQLDALAAGGVLFANAWANPICSPTRAALQTGRYGFRTGVGQVVDCSLSPLTQPTDGLHDEEITLAEMVMLRAGAPYSTAAIGKWHLSTSLQGGLLGPNQQGYDHFEGIFCGFPRDYYDWIKVTNGTPSVETEYVTTNNVNSALNWIAQASEPWLCYVGFANPHVPYHTPPSNLFTVDLSGAGPPETDPRPYYKAQVEALDTEIGRLLGSLGSTLEKTTVIFIGDNGTPNEVIQPPYTQDQGKRSLYQGGIHVPLIISGPKALTPGVSNALVSAVDIFATVAELAGVDLHEVESPGRKLDSVSLVPYLENPAAPSQRETIMAELFGPNGPKEGLMTSPPDAFLCQPDLGYGGPGNSALAVCGQPLYLNNEASLTLTNAPASAAGLLFRSPIFDPQPMFGGIITPGSVVSPEVIFTDLAGEYAVPLLDLQDYYVLRTYYPESHTIYVQIAVEDPPQSGGYSISNTVGMELPGWNVKAVRNDRYKLIIDLTGGPAEFYDLLSDPYEQIDLMTLGLTPNEQSQFDLLKAEVLALIASE